MPQSTPSSSKPSGLGSTPPVGWSEILTLAASANRSERKDALYQARVRLTGFLKRCGFLAPHGHVNKALREYAQAADLSIRQLAAAQDALELRNKVHYERYEPSVNEVVKAVEDLAAVITSGSSRRHPAAADPRPREAGSPRTAVPHARRAESRRAEEVRPRTAPAAGQNPRSGDAAVSDLKVTQEVDAVDERDQRGIRVDVTLTVAGLRGVTCRAIAYFSTGDGTALRDVDAQYFSSNGQVAVGEEFTPPADGLQKPLALFIPYAQLHLPGGMEQVRYDLQVVKLEGRVLLAHPAARLVRWGAAAARIDDLAVAEEVGVTDDLNQRGLRINVTFRASNLRGATCRATAHFFGDDGAPLRDVDGRCHSPTGQVAVEAEFCPREDDARSEVALFVPHLQLHLPEGVEHAAYEVQISRRDGGVWIPLTRSAARRVSLRALLIWIHDVAAAEDLGATDERGQPGLGIRVTFKAMGLRGTVCKVTAVFTGPSTAAGRLKVKAVAVAQAKFTPREDDVACDIPLFIPSAQLHLPDGLHRLTYTLSIVKAAPDAWVPLAPPVKRSVVVLMGPVIQNVGLSEELDADDPARGRGLRVRVKFRAMRLKGVRCEVAAFFRGTDGTPLKDTDGVYRSQAGDHYKNTPGQVAVAQEFTAAEEDASEDIGLFLPYPQLHLPDGRHRIAYSVQISKRDAQGWALLSGPHDRSVDVELALAAIQDLTVTEEVDAADERGQLGLRIRVAFRTRALKNAVCRVAAGFSAADGTPLSDVDGQYKDAAGNVSAGRSLTERGENSRHDVHLYMPYPQLHLPDGRHRIKYTVSILTLAWQGPPDQRRELWVPLSRSDDRPVEVHIRPAAGIVDFFVSEERERGGLRLGVRFRAFGLKDSVCWVMAGFSALDGTLLPDTDGRYRNGTGKVSAGEQFTPREEDSRHEFRLVMPYGQLHLPDGRHQLQYFVTVVKKQGDGWVTLSRSTDRPLAVELSTPAIRDLLATETIDAVDQHGERGLRIRVQCRAVVLAGARCEITAFFSFEDGTVLKDFDGNFRNPDGDVCVSSTFAPEQDDVRVDRVLFIPYAQLHLADGRHSLRYFIQVGKQETQGGSTLVRSPYRPFAVTWAAAPAAIEVGEQLGVRDPTLGLGASLSVSFDVPVVALQEGQIAAYFYGPDGTPLRDADGAYGTSSSPGGQVVVWTTAPLTPGRKTWQLFMPYAQLHLPAGRHAIKCVVSVFKRGSGGTWTEMLQAPPRVWSVEIPAGA